MESSDKKNQKKEEAEKREKEIEEKVKTLDASTKELKLKKDNLKQNFLNTIKSLLGLNIKKVKNEKLIEDVYLLTAKLIETALVEKELTNFHESLNDEEKAELNKFFYSTYDRITKKQNCLSLKPAKIYNLQHTLINSVGPGLVCRSLFSIQK